jgi:hypothetical protein
MQAAQRRLDELVLDVLAPPPDHTEHDLVTIELCDEDDLSTTQFVRSDYDAIEIAPARPSAPRIRSTTYVQPVRVFDPAWFDRPVDHDEVVAPPRANWWWLALSIAIAAAVVIYGSYAL